MEMQQSFLSVLLLFSITIIYSEVLAEKELHYHRDNGKVKLFVFGDSYVDTGNWDNFSDSWREPYGMTYPGKPSGRFSDGRVFTDFIASHFGIPSPVAYRLRQSVAKSHLNHGMNFAYGGTGVFDTWVSQPNLTTQVNFFQQLVNKKLYTKQHLHSSVALVSVAGNDYGAYRAPNGKPQNFTSLAISIINQLVVDLKRIHDLGVRKIVITAIEPLGCLPLQTASYSYLNCSEIGNSLAKFHNQILHEAVQKLNNNSDGPVFMTLDLYSAFTSALNKQYNPEGNWTLENRLKPCCVGISRGETCGSVEDKSGVKKYEVCNKPEFSFFWDLLHPTQHGWQEIYLALLPSLPFSQQS